MFFFSKSYSQTYYRMGAATNGSTINFTCPINNTRFADDGSGSTHYSNNGDYTITFCAPAGKLLKFDFGCGSNLTIERIHPSDTLFAYDGSSTSDPLLFAITGNPSNSNRLPYFDETSVFAFLSPSNCITFRFKSNASNNDDGWDACITCVDELTCGINEPASDLFGGAPYICNLNNYCGTTSGDFGEDYPANLNPSGGNCPSTLNFLGTIENNSWLKFIASSNTATFDFNVPLGGSCLNGIQAAVFAYDGATLTRMTPCGLSDGSHSGTFQLTATGLIPGDTYYLMIDGNAGDICDYTINANTGVAVVSAGVDQTICSGSIVNLTASGPPGATYVWNSTDGVVVNQVGASQTFSPTVNTTYVVSVSGGGACSNTSGVDTVDVSMCIVLPLLLNDFNVECENSIQRISWMTSAEVGVHYFKIEKSSDGIHFFLLDSVQASGYSNHETYYHLYDDSGTTWNTYYRLSSVDFDGTVTYYPILVSNKFCSSEDWIIFPNPTNGLINISFQLNDKKMISLKVYNVLGQEIMNSNNNQYYSEGSHIISLDLSNYALGYYLIEMNSSERKFSRLVLYQK